VFDAVAIGMQGRCRSFGMKLIVAEQPPKQWYATGRGGRVPGPRRMGIYTCSEQQISKRARVEKNEGDNWG